MEEIISEDPVVYIKRDFITHNECKHFINISKDRLQQAMVSDNKGPSASKGRSGKNCWIDHDHDTLVKRVCERISTLVGVPLENAEKVQVVYYGVNQEYRLHHDGWLFDGSEKAVRCMKYGGQRIWTALCYLNTLPEADGGHTRMTKLNTNVQAEEGKLLVFSNVHKGSINRHDLSEHAGMPVKKGEKWAFNLWFREQSRRTLVYDPPNVIPVGIDNTLATTGKPNKSQITAKEQIVAPPDEQQLELSIKEKELTDAIKSTQTESESLTYGVHIYNNVFTVDELLPIMQSLSFYDNEDRSATWVKNEDVPNFIEKVSSLSKTNSNFYENVCFVKYKPNYVHNYHLDAYDQNSEMGKKYTSKFGQRLFTITGILSESTQLEFKKQRNHELSINSMIKYCNVLPGTTTRNESMHHKITNSNDNGAVIFHIYVRERNSQGQNYYQESRLDIKPDIPMLPASDVPVNELVPVALSPLERPPSVPPSLEKEKEVSFDLSKNKVATLPPPLEDYKSTLLTIYDKFNKNDCPKSGYKDVQFVNKVSWPKVCSYVNQLHVERQKDKKYGALNEDNFKTSYYIDEYNPVKVENLLKPDILKLVQEYYKTSIDAGEFDIGDRQSHRYKARNETLSRLIHYEVHPLIEHIVGEKMKPTYTYLSAYPKGSELPAHTDQPDCEFTASFMVNKPEGCHWPIYVHKVKQTQKNKGRYGFTPPKEECLAIDCNPGGLMMFNGTDHIHYREVLEHDYCHIILLHYRRV